MGARGPTQERQRPGRPPGPRDENGLEEEPVASRRVGVETEGIVPVDELADVAGEDRDEEQPGSKPDECASSPRDKQGRTEGNLGKTGHNHDEVLVESHPVGDLRLEVLAGKRQVGHTCEDERRTEDQAGRRPDPLSRW